MAKRLAVPPCMSDLGPDQKKTVDMNESELVLYHGQARDAGVLLEKKQLFSKDPSEPGASFDTAGDVKMVCQTLSALCLCSVPMQGRAQLAILSAFPARTRKWWVKAFEQAPASTTGHGEGSKIFCALRNLLVAFTTNAEKSMVLQAMEEFQWHTNFEMCWIAITRIFDWYDHAVATTAGNKYMRLRLPTMSMGQKLDFLVNAALRENILWPEQVLTMPGAESVACLDSAYVHLSQHSPGAATAAGHLHSMVRGPPRCFFCHELGHMQNQCPRRPADNTSGSGPLAMASHGRPPAARPFHPTPVAPLHTLQQQSSDLMADLRAQFETARLTHEAISQAFETPAYDITAAARESAHVGQPAQGLHYLSSVDATTSPSAVRDEYYRQQGAHVFEGEVFWD